MKTLKFSFVALFFCASFVSCKQDNNKTAPAEETAETVQETTKVEHSESYAVDSGTINWTGSKPAGKHTGTINIAQGKLLMGNGKLIAGKFEIDMNSITVTDLEGDGKADLEAHLKGTEAGKEDHFFNVAKYPSALFNITKVASLQNDPEATHLVYGDLTIRDVTKNIGIKANVATNDGKVNVTTNEFNINRTDYGIQFMSKSFFDDLKDKFIDDEIAISINLTASTR